MSGAYDDGRYSANGTGSWITIALRELLKAINVIYIY